VSVFRLSLCSVLLSAFLFTSAAAQETNPYVAWYTDSAGAAHSNCTFWAWQRWYDVYGEALPSWGNAGQWATNAAASGYSVSNTPTVGSIVVTWESPIGHVAFVEAVSPDDPNTFLISEYGFAVGIEYHERWMTTDGSLLFIHPHPVASSAAFPGDGTAGDPNLDTGGE
jgi:surface antigen